MSEHKSSENAAIIEFAKQNGDVAMVNLPDGHCVASVPQGRSLVGLHEYMDKYLEVPRRLKGTSQHITTASICEHINRSKDDSSVLFANGNLKEPKVMAVYNYNHAHPLPAVPGGPPQISPQRFGDHRAVLHCELSDEWKAWKEQNKKGMSQVEFAEFIETRILDIQDPPDMALPQNADWKDLQAILGYRFAKQNEIMKLSRGLTVNENCKVGSSVNLSTGEQMVVFESEHVGEDGAKLNVPQLFMIAIPVFKDGRLCRFGVRLRYKKAASLSWAYDIYRIDDGFQKAYDDVCQEVRLQTDLPMFNGSPE